MSDRTLRLAIAATAVAGVAVSAYLTWVHYQPGGFAAYLVILQLTVIHVTCVWCMVNDVVLAPALTVLAGLRVLRD